MDIDLKGLMQILAIAFLGAAGLIWIYKGDNTNAAWAFGAIAVYAFKNGIAKVQNKK